MELHAVHFNTKFGSNLMEALQNSGNAHNTLAVLAVMFEVAEEDNPLLKPIVDGEQRKSIFKIGNFS
jgi:carbonic anhydrase